MARSLNTDKDKSVSLKTCKKTDDEKTKKGHTKSTNSVGKGGKGL